MKVLFTTSYSKENLVCCCSLQRQLPGVVLIKKIKNKKIKKKEKKEKKETKRKTLENSHENVCNGDLHLAKVQALFDRFK